MTSLTKLFVALSFLMSFAAQAASEMEAPLSTDTAALVEEEILGAPQIIPHEITQYLPITTEKNACLMCHKMATGDAQKRGEIPTSHLENGKVAGSRWNCLFCHAPMKPIETAPSTP